MLLLLVACRPVVEDTGSGCEDAPTWDGFAHGFFTSYCDSCHAADTPDRQGAPTTVTFDTEAEAAAQAENVRRTVLDMQTMPPGGGVFDEDLVKLAAWVDCP
jgi:uncharacterized membrane protein